MGERVAWSVWPVVLVAAVVGGLANAGAQTPTSAQESTARVQRALERLPYYGVFDFLAFSWDRGTVTLMGYAYRGSFKKEAEHAVRRVAGVDDVVNKIELLPASQSDETIRWATFAAVYGDDHFARYIPGGPLAVRYDFNVFSRFPNMQPVGMYPVHIIVKGLRTTLVGMVDTDLDRTVAWTRARGVHGALEVDNEIVVRARRGA